MSIFPNETISITTDQASSILSGVLLPTSTYDRTMVYCSISTDATEAHIGSGATSTNSNFCDTETNGWIQNFSPIIIPAGQHVVWDKAGTNKRAFFSFSYLDYNLNSTTADTSTDMQVTSTAITSVSNDIKYLVIIGIIISSILLIDLIRRLFQFNRI